MTDISPAPTAVPQPLWDAIRELDLPKRHLKDLTAFPDEAGEILLEAVDVLRERDEHAARTLADALREHAPKTGHRQFATNQIVTMLRAEGRTDEADALLKELMDPGLDRGVAVLLAEDLATRGDYDKALHCYNVVCRGMLAQPPETVAELNRLGLLPLLGRARMREALGMAPDAHDLATRSTDAYLPPLENDLRGAPSGHLPTDERPAPSPGRNEPCSCGSGRKFKKCCGSPLAR
ncbi:SEC-C metal-binding domain-containing protein [Nocardiopsis sp. SBT366]|uniref:SEC-C metal-binding domain-containing protein n=1 Tax=Nocardiopsis sp. SBT366 TaxID=1580529 RepID=UPI00066AEF6C|nr:SEC-C metal-binding domain-containing protein [Nocardiopsis sp. SBT366]